MDTAVPTGFPCTPKEERPRLTNASRSRAERLRLGAELKISKKKKMSFDVNGGGGSDRGKVRAQESSEASGLLTCP